LAATLDVKAFLNEDKLNAIFNQFDTDGSGYISRENIVTALTKMGHEITQEELDDSMKKHDIEKNGVITRDEFKALFLDTSDLYYAKNFTLASTTPNSGETIGR
jgi:Ca2+-binding EF-hand superfamily protein